MPRTSERCSTSLTLLTGAVVGSIALTGCSAENTKMPSAPTPSISYSAQTPEQAAYSILHGTQCKFDSGKGFSFYNASRKKDMIDATLKLRIVQSVGSIAARKQYNSDDAVEWRGQTIEAIAFTKKDGTVTQQGEPMLSTESKELNENTGAVLPGNAPDLNFALYDVQKVGTYGGKYNTFGTLCGVVHLDGNTLVSTPDFIVPTTISE